MILGKLQKITDLNSSAIKGDDSPYHHLWGFGRSQVVKICDLKQVGSVVQKLEKHRCFMDYPLVTNITGWKWLFIVDLWDFHGFYEIYPLVMTNRTGWKMAKQIVDFPIQNMVIFHSKLLT